MVHRVLYLLACSCIAGQDSDATAATQSEQDLPTMNSGAMITTIIHFTLRQTVAKRNALGGGMLRCCTVHVQKKMVSSDVQRMVSVERTSGLEIQWMPLGGRVLLVVKMPVSRAIWTAGREVEQRR